MHKKKQKVPLVTGEYYHVFNRGVDKRQTFNNKNDLYRFVQSLIEFNNDEPIGSIYENSFTKNTSSGKKLVRIVSFCLNPNHFHLILKQESDRGIEKFMKKVGSGYTQYFNKQNKRSGVLFQGQFKYVHIDTNEYLLYVINYVNLNNKIHGIPGTEPFYSSWLEYTNEGVKNLMGNYNGLCDKEIILSQFKSKIDYKKEAENLLPKLIEQKEKQKELEN